MHEIEIKSLNEISGLAMLAKLFNVFLDGLFESFQGILVRWFEVFNDIFHNDEEFAVVSAPVFVQILDTGGIVMHFPHKVKRHCDMGESA